MTSRQIFESLLIELSKVNAPSLMLSEFNYYMNKAVSNYINKRYNIYDINQQTTDDIRVLKSTTYLTPILANINSNAISTRNQATYEVNLPSDYLHLLNCICYYRVHKDFKCFNAGDLVPFAAKRLTADSWSVIINDYYNRPAPERPYYYIHNVNPNLNQEQISTNPVIMNQDNLVESGTDMAGLYKVESNGFKSSEINYDLKANTGSNLPRVIKIVNDDEAPATVSTVERATAYRYGNASQVRMEIRYGKDNTLFELVEIQVDYIKTPQTIRLTQEQMDLTEDTSQIMEFPDYVCQEIINELTILVMARTGDPLLNAFAQVNQTIANPAQAQPQPTRPAPQQGE